MKHIRTSRVISPRIAAAAYACPKPAFHAVAAGQLRHRIAVSLLVALLGGGGGEPSRAAPRPR